MATSLLNRDINQGEIHVEVELVSDASGDASITVTGLPKRKWCMQWVINPDGTDVPTASFDITAVDSNGADLMNGQGADLSETATTTIDVASNGNGALAEGDITITGAAMGNAKKAIVILYGSLYLP